MTKKTALFSILLIAVFILGACAGEQGPQGEAGPAGPEGPAGEQGPAGPAGTSMAAADLSCTDCHNDTTLITGKRTAWEESAHGSGSAYSRGTRSSCAGCHSGGAFSERIAAGLSPGEVEEGDPNPTRQECRTCHQIHTTYTKDDFALETTDAVTLFAVEGQTFDGGEGNLCANCHQPRRVYPEAVDGMIEDISGHWGPHHGGESIMLMGLGGVGVEGEPSKHYTQVDDTCVSCHMGENSNHSFEPDVSACVECHDDVEDFDIEGVQTEVQAKIDELEEILIGLGLLDEEGHPAVETAPEELAGALWNWIYIAHEDGSLGVHNPKYTLDLLNWSLEQVGGGE